MSLYVTGFAKRDHIWHFEIRIFQGSVFLQHYVQPESNVGVLWRRHCCSTDLDMKSLDYTVRELQGRVHGICNCSEFFEKWHYYQGAYPWNGESIRLLVWYGIG